MPAPRSQSRALAHMDARVLAWAPSRRGDVAPKQHPRTWLGTGCLGGLAATSVFRETSAGPHEANKGKALPPDLAPPNRCAVGDASAARGATISELPRAGGTVKAGPDAEPAMQPLCRTSAEIHPGCAAGGAQTEPTGKGGEEKPPRMHRGDIAMGVGEQAAAAAAAAADKNIGAALVDGWSNLGEKPAPLGARAAIDGGSANGEAGNITGERSAMLTLVAGGLQDRRDNLGAMSPGAGGVEHVHLIMFGDFCGGRAVKRSRSPAGDAALVAMPAGSAGAASRGAGPQEEVLGEAAFLGRGPAPPPAGDMACTSAACELRAARPPSGGV